MRASGAGRLLLVGVGNVGSASFVEVTLADWDGCCCPMIVVELACEGFLLEGVRKKLATCGGGSWLSLTKASQSESMCTLMFACLTGCPQIGQSTIA